MHYTDNSIIDLFVICLQVSVNGVRIKFAIRMCAVYRRSLQPQATSCVALLSARLRWAMLAEAADYWCCNYLVKPTWTCVKCASRVHIDYTESQLFALRQNATIATSSFSTWKSHLFPLCITDAGSLRLVQLMVDMLHTYGHRHRQSVCRTCIRGLLTALRSFSQAVSVHIFGIGGSKLSNAQATAVELDQLNGECVINLIFVSSQHVLV